jgi:hypothetical protein
MWCSGALQRNSLIRRLEMWLHFDYYNNAAILLALGIILVWSFLKDKVDLYATDNLVLDGTFVVKAKAKYLFGFTSFYIGLASILLVL